MKTGSYWSNLFPCETLFTDLNSELGRVTVWMSYDPDTGAHTIEDIYDHPETLAETYPAGLLVVSENWERVAR